MPTLDDFPAIKAFLNPHATDTHLEKREIGGTTFIRVTQLFAEGEGEQLLFAAKNGVVDFVAVDNVVEYPSLTLSPEALTAYHGTMTDREHAAVAQKAIELVDVFKTGDGPGHGNVACLWAARRVVHDAVKQWITKRDGTSKFHEELQAGGMKPVAADSLPPGAIIISPTTPQGVGHIGLLGAGSGGSRLVYSNHSPSKKDPVARWKQNYTVKSFTERHEKMGLQTLFYRLPKP